MTDRELKSALHAVFQKYRDSGVLSQSFRDGLAQYYTSSNPKLYINRMQYFVDLFDQGKGDARYVDFKAYKEKGVIYCNMREKPFYESMPTEPEVVLADLIQIFHPQLLSGHQPGYYELLK